MAKAWIFILLLLFLLPTVSANEMTISKDSPDTYLVLTERGFGYRTTINTGDNEITLNVPSNIEIIYTSIEPNTVQEKNKDFLIFTLYQGKIYSFKDVKTVEIVFVYPNGYGQFDSNLYKSLLN